MTAVEAIALLFRLAEKTDALRVEVFADGSGSIDWEYYEGAKTCTEPFSSQNRFPGALDHARQRIEAED